MKVAHLERCHEFMEEHGVMDLTSPEAYSIMIDYAYSHRTGRDPDMFVAAMRRWWSAKSHPKG
jgi:hypothetical protein